VRLRPIVILAVLGLGVLAACSPDDDAVATVPAEAGFPMTINNCGFEVTFEAPPQRVVTVKSSTAEMMLALGLGDRIVGTAFLDGPIPDALASAAAGTAVEHPLADRVPGTEATLALEPDLIFAGWESNITTSGVGDRAALAGFGVNTLVAPAACQAPPYRPESLTFDDVFAQLLLLGRLFDVPLVAEALVAEQRAALATVSADSRGLTALWWSSGSDIPFVGGGIGAPQMLMTAVGLTNIAANIDESWSSFSWELVMAADPDVLVLVDADWNAAERKIEHLENHPGLRELTAVREGRFLIVAFPATEAGVRNVEAAQSLATQLHALAFDD